jgi:hypothetical protein
MGLILDPLKPERLDHMLIAVGCVLATVAAIVASLLHGLALFARG